MTKSVKAIDYRDLTAVTFKKKSSLFFLGLAVFLTFVLAITSLSTLYLNNRSPKEVAKKQTKGETAPKYPTSYTVVDGDTLAAISQKLYGSDIYVPVIMQANKLETAENLEVGQKLVIPKVKPLPAQGQIGEGLMTEEVTHAGETYTVQPGDTLSIIAFKVYGDINAWVKIAEANGLVNPEVVEEGTILKIPKN